MALEREASCEEEKEEEQEKEEKKKEEKEEKEEEEDGLCNKLREKQADEDLSNAQV